MQRSYLDYAMSVIVSRALPDVRDGLKPVHRRILYAMHEGGFHWNRKYVKSSRIVGDVMGKYHPHGDAAIYDAMVRMAQDWSMRLPLIDGQGNFGSIDGDPPAAMRYTESRLEKVAHDLLEDIDKETVDFQENYDSSSSEPKVLPARFPNLLANGSGGIAVGMATNIPPHNLGEVIDATLAVIDDPMIDEDQLLEIVPGPDFPTGGLIMGMSGSRKALTTGRGSVIMRAKTDIEETKNGRQAIIVTEIPYQVNKARLLEKIAELVKDKKIDGITDPAGFAKRVADELACYSGLAAIMSFSPLAVAALPADIMRGQLVFPSNSTSQAAFDYICAEVCAGSADYIAPHVSDAGKLRDRLPEPVPAVTWTVRTEADLKAARAADAAIIFEALDPALVTGAALP